MFLEKLFEKHEEILNEIADKLMLNEEFEPIAKIMDKLEQLPDTPEQNQIYYVFYKEDMKWLLGKYLKEKYDLDYEKHINGNS